MRRLLVLLITLILTAGSATAQTVMPQPGDPPNAALISISAPDASGEVTIQGVTGAISPNANVIIRNLYTQETVSARTGVTGSFGARIRGDGNTPFWISPTVQTVTEAQRDQLGSLPGGAGVIIYGAYPTTDAPTPLPITALAVDGEGADWSRFTEASVASGVSALRNTNSLYTLITAFPDNYVRLEVRFTVDTVTYGVTLDPRQVQPAALERINPSVRALGPLAVAARQASAIELRIPFTFTPRSDNVRLESISFYDDAGATLLDVPVAQALERRDEIDGVFRPQGVLGGARFTLGGTLARGAATWTAIGRAESVDLTPGQTLRVELDVRLQAADVPADLQMIGTLALQPVALDQGGTVRVVSDARTNNGWSSVRTASGLAIDNLNASVPLGEAVAEPYQLVREDAHLLFPLDYALTLPADLTPGLYVPVFRGFAQSPDGTRVSWNANGVFGTGEGVFPDDSLTRLPLVVNVGAVSSAHLLWTLFMDDPSDGSRGVLADEDRNHAALSNRTRFNSRTYILPPGTYSLEPSLLNQMANLYTYTGEPLVPFKFPSGSLMVSVTRPDRSVDDLGTQPILQSSLSSTAFDERTRFGAQSPVDIYSLTTLNPALTDYVFDQYGDYQISLTGELEDLWGNHYTGGGTYRVTIAEPLDLTPGVVPGTPFEVGDAFNPGLIIAPGVSADVDVRLRIFPLTGQSRPEYRLDGRTNRFGTFQPAGESYRFDTPGEYLVDYEARFRDRQGRLWAASLRSAGVIASADASVILHGERGLPDQPAELRPAWFELPQYSSVLGVEAAEAQLNMPYFSGDSALIGDDDFAGLHLALRVQDLDGAYQSALLNAFPAAQSAQAMPLTQLAAEDELPIIGLNVPDSAYAYLSAVRPGITVRQLVIGDQGTDTGLPLYWDSDDPHNQQIGAGSGGELPGDYIFLFGGVILREAEVSTAAIYGAVATVIEDERDSATVPPGRRPILVLPDASYDMLVYPTALRPGAIIVEGETVSMGGQVAPTLPADVAITVTAPSGRQFQYTATANAVGYFYLPDAAFTADEIGVWTATISASYGGAASVGIIDPISGGVVGADGGSFAFYVVPRNVELLPWNTNLQDTPIPVAIQYNFNFVFPDDWTDIRVFETLTMPGHILEDGELRISGRSFTYTLNPSRLTAAFPNLENDANTRGAWASDARVLTFVVLGTNGAGQPDMQVRQFTILHDRLVSFE